MSLPGRAARRTGSARAGEQKADGGASSARPLIKPAARCARKCRLA